jgi:TolB-like protein/lipoprotein NlpI
MKIWSAEIKELEKLSECLKGQFPELEKELGQLIKTEDENVVMLYSRRCLEVIITDLCECELKRPRKTEPLKGIIDKLNKEEKVPSNIIASMHGLNSLSTYGAHPKDFDPEQVKPVLINLDIIIKWYLKYKDSQNISKTKAEEEKFESKHPEVSTGAIRKPKKRLIILISGLFIVAVSIVALVEFNIIGIGKQAKGLTKLEKSIAVLPFISLSDDPEKQYLADGMMDAILLHLSKIEDLRVMSRTSVEQYRKTDKASNVIGQELDVAYLLEGSFQKYGDNARLIVQLIKTGKEGHVWANDYDRNWIDIFSVQSEVAEAIAAELKVVITPQEKQLIEKTPTANLAAYEAYLQGKFYWRKFTQNNLDLAMQYFEQAKGKDPEYALAYAGICDVWYQRQQMGFTSPAEAVPKAMAALTKAFELDSTRAEVHYTLGIMNKNVMWDWKDSESEFKKAIALNPNYADAHASYSNLLIIVGRLKEAMEQIELARKLDPLNPLCKSLYGITLLFACRYEDAITAFQDALRMDPTNPLALANLPLALHMIGSYEEEVEPWKSYYNSTFKDFTHVFDQGYVKAGYAGALNLEADTLVAQSKTNYINPTEIAVLYACAGNKKRALDMLESAYEVHDPNMPYLQYPVFDILRNEPRFQDLCRKMNLPYKRLNI